MSLGLGAVVAATAFVGLGAMPASAAVCSSLTRDGRNITGSCAGNVQFSWTCTSDLFQTVNYRTINFGLGQSFSFRACDVGSPDRIGHRLV